MEEWHCLNRIDNEPISSERQRKQQYTDFRITGNVAWLYWFRRDNDRDNDLEYTKLNIIQPNQSCQHCLKKYIGELYDGRHHGVMKGGGGV
jgi:hypothetical protein